MSELERESAREGEWEKEREMREKEREREKMRIKRTVCKAMLILTSAHLITTY